MRFISTDRIAQGMKLAFPIYTIQGDILVTEGYELNERVIGHIKKHEYNGIYIRDKYSEDLSVNVIIDTHLKTKMAATLKEVSNYLKRGLYPDRQVRSLKDGVEEIINGVINNKNLMVNIVDIKVRKDYQYYHAVATCLLSIIMGFELGMNRLELYSLGVAGLFHDIGKAMVPEHVVDKVEKLTPTEEKVLGTHAYKGYKFLTESNNFSSQICVGVLDHHEKFDGSGYPNQKKGRDIFLYGRIVAIASAYDALTSDKPYKKAIPPSDAMEYIMGGSGTIFDPELVQIFPRKLQPNPTGTKVRLGNEVLGMVINNHEDCCIRPQIRVLKEGGQEVEPYYLDLKNDTQAVSVTILSLGS